MKRIILAAVLGGLALPAGAQTTLLTASPIPDDAEKRFCYYGGLAYSVNAYILVGGSGGVTQVSGLGGSQLGEGAAAMHPGTQVVREDERKPLQCVAGEGGVLGWKPVASIQLGQ